MRIDQKDIAYKRMLCLPFQTVSKSSAKADKEKKDKEKGKRTRMRRAGNEYEFSLVNRVKNS